MANPSPFTLLDLAPSEGLADRLKAQWAQYPSGLTDGTSWPHALSAAAQADGQRSQWGAVWLAFAQAVADRPSLLPLAMAPAALDGMLETALRPEGFSRTDTALALDAMGCLLTSLPLPEEASRVLAHWVNSPQATSDAVPRFLAWGASPHVKGSSGHTVFQRAVSRLWVNASSANAWTESGADWEGLDAEGKGVLHLVLSGPDNWARREALKTANAHVRPRAWAVPDSHGVSARDCLAAYPAMLAAFPDIRRRADGAVSRRQARATERVLDEEMPAASRASRRRM